MAEVIIDNLNLWTSALLTKSTAGRGRNGKLEAYGIRKLRELILELAVRGKLVPQDANDEPASVLLERIEKEKARLIKEGKIKKGKPPLVITAEDQPFELPNGWAFVRLGNIALSQAGFGFKSRFFNEIQDGLPLIRIRDVGQPFTGTYYSGEYREEFLVKNGDYLISMDGEFRVSPWANGAALLNQRVSRLIFFDEGVGKRFIADSLQARLRELRGVKAYTTVDHLSGTQITESVIGLPPLAEQHRIVAKVDELMALCDQLEQQQTDSLAAQKILVETLLGTLTRVESQQEFSVAWARIANHFDTLFTTESSIDELKQTILQLAVMGKLVPQDPNDEPASESLKKVTTERAKLEKEGVNRKQESLSLVEPEELPYELPQSWVWTRLQDIAFFQEGPGILAKDFRETGIPLIRIAGMHKDLVSLEGCNFLDEDMVKKKWAHFKLELGDIVLSSSASLGKVAKVGDETVGCIVYTGLIRFQPYACLDGDYLIAFLNSNEFLSQINKSKTGAAIMHFGPTHLKGMLVPLAPLAEQHRIVAKVEELMALCDALKARISGAQTTQIHLADAIVEQAVC